jgi:hypothetical protein
LQLPPNVDLIGFSLPVPKFSLLCAGNLNRSNFGSLVLQSKLVSQSKLTCPLPLDDDKDDEFCDLIMVLLGWRMFVSRGRGDIEALFDCVLSSPLVVVMTIGCPPSSDEVLRGLLFVVETIAAVWEEEISS